MTNTVRGKPALVRDGVRGLTEKEIKHVAGGLDVGKFFRTVASDVVTSMKGAAPAAHVAGRVPIVGSELAAEVELGAASAGFGFGLVHGWYEATH
jgi:hypothetical protein